MEVYEMKLKVKLKKDIFLKDVSTYITRFMDMNLSVNPTMYNYHTSKIYKGYIFDGLFPIEEDKIYKKNKEYFSTLRIRLGCTLLLHIRLDNSCNIVWIYIQFCTLKYDSIFSLLNFKILTFSQLV